MKEETGLAVRQNGGLARPTSFAPTTFTEAMQFSSMVASSELAPKDYKGKPENVFIAIQMGAELGLNPMAALQNIAVINGRGAVWGDAALAIVQAHPSYEWHKEWMDGEGDDRAAFFQIKRKGQEPHTVKFSVADAKRAKLWMKKGYNGGDTPWVTYPERMMMWRARGYGLRDKFADALKGVITAEEAMDIPPETNYSQAVPESKPEIVAPQRKSTQAGPITAEVVQSTPEPEKAAPAANAPQQTASQGNGAGTSKLIEAFAALKVTPEMLAGYLGHAELEGADIEELRKVYKILKAGELTWDELVQMRKEQDALKNPPSAPIEGEVVPPEDNDPVLDESQRRRMYAVMAKGRPEGVKASDWEKVGRQWIFTTYKIDSTAKVKVKWLDAIIAHFEAVAAPESGEKA